MQRNAALSQQVFAAFFAGRTAVRLFAAAERAAAVRGVLRTVLFRLSAMIIPDRGSIPIARPGARCRQSADIVHPVQEREGRPAGDPLRKPATATNATIALAIS